MSFIAKDLFQKKFFGWQFWFSSIMCMSFLNTKSLNKMKDNAGRSPFKVMLIKRFFFCTMMLLVGMTMFFLLMFLIFYLIKDALCRKTLKKKARRINLTNWQFFVCDLYFMKKLYYDMVYLLWIHRCSDRKFHNLLQKTNNIFKFMEISLVLVYRSHCFSTNKPPKHLKVKTVINSKSQL